MTPMTYHPSLIDITSSLPPTSRQSSRGSDRKMLRTHEQQQSEEFLSYQTLSTRPMTTVVAKRISKESKLKHEVHIRKNVQKAQKYSRES
ncbi:hypothetical protein KIN20_015709 [Parelaphostrongylus tenuis]|uniref:Uncharacterized protein n=1 Tax=Parelaphostrongylus tenuis TaxID=148309 RepID=A0AAD5QMF5_PARTN|nr:hypothetical protein KIN20_015709 [Parelaphostrongylus tenuis]